MNITLYPLGAYVSGYCLPFTIELDGMDQEDYNQAVSSGLYHALYKRGDGNVLSCKCLGCGEIKIAAVEKECKKCGGIYFEVKQTDEEWIVCDYEDIPREYVGEYDLSSDFFAYSEFLANTSFSRDIIDAGLALGIDLLKIEEAYRGTADSDEDFAEEWAESTGALNDSATWPYNCIDWGAAARELLQSFSDMDHHYFDLSY